MTAYYNEFDPKAAAWLRELIKRGLIAPGDVDERSINDVRPADLSGYVQCHFFAGIGTWSYALRRAGWEDSRPVWTGSCPCQPFSAAGKRASDSDERHLWPAWFRLIAECRPDVCFGEQVSSKDGLAWIDHVRLDMEGAGYALGVLDTCAAGVGAPHIRQRLYFVADAKEGRCGAGRERGGLSEEISWGRADESLPVEERSSSRLLADPSLGGRREFRDDSVAGDGRYPDGGSIVGNAILPRLEGHTGDGSGGVRQVGEVSEPDRSTGEADVPDGSLAYPDGGNTGAERIQRGGEHGLVAPHRGPCNGFWSDALWIPCRDGKARPTQPGIFPLVDGAPARVVRLRGYGNGLVAPQAIEFVRAYVEAIPGGERMSDDVVAFKHAFCPECGPVKNSDEDGCCLMCGADVIVGTEFDKLVDAKEEAERKLCRGRWLVGKMRPYTTQGDKKVYWGGEWLLSPEDAKDLDDALSSSSPCPHEEEAKRNKLGVDSDSRVFFYERDFYIFSNFSAFNLKWGPTIFGTSEAAYHWEKFPGNMDLQCSIMTASSAHEALKIAEKFSAERRPDWLDVRVDIMRKILFAKAEQHEYVRRKLLATGDRELIEDSWRDDFWGWGPNRDGQNTLGKLWMEVRAELRRRAGMEGK